MRLVKGWLVLAAVCCMWGCSGDERPAPSATNSAGTNNGAVTNNGVSTNNGGPTNNGALNNPQALAEVVLRLERQDVDLFGAASPPADLELPLAYIAADEEWVGELQWPPGIYQAFLLSDGEEAGPYNNAQINSEIGPIPGFFRWVPSFNPAPRLVRVRVRGTVEDPQITVEDINPEPDRASDSPEPRRSGGAWFDEQLVEWGGQDLGTRVVELMDVVREHGGPIHTDYGVLFIAPARDDETPPQIRGSWNNWEADPNAELRRIAPSLWARYVEVPAGRHEYKIVYGDGESWQTDLSNPHVAWDGIDPGTVGSFNSVLAPTQREGGRLVWWPGVESPELGNARDVYVYLPDGYDESATRYPALYVHDGNESIVRGRFHEVADATFAAGPSAAALLVFVALPSQDIRLQEYTMGTDGARGDDYVTFLADTLVPLIEVEHRARAERSARGLVGASLGGLISFWGAMQRPEVFGYAAGMSSSFFWGEGFVPMQLQTRGCQDVRYYLDSGSPDDNHDVTVGVRDQLAAMGCDFEYVLEEGGEHDWFFWNGRFGGTLRHFAELHGG